MSGPAPSIQYSWDGPGTLGAGQDALYLRWNNAAGRFEMASVTVPSTLDDLSDVTVTGAAQGAVLYRNASAWVHLPAGTSGQALLSGGAGANPAWGAAGVTAHSGLSGLTSDDDHTQYALLAGRSGGQTLNLDTASGGAGTVNASAHATKGALTLGASQVLVPVGTAGAPSVAGATDTNTGMALLGGDTLIFSTAGTQRMAMGTGLITTGLSTRIGGYLTVDGASGTTTTINAGSAATVGFTVKLAASPTANGIEVQSSAAVVLTRFDSTGKLYFGAESWRGGLGGDALGSGSLDFYQNGSLVGGFISSQLRILGGSAASPSLAFTTDADTGLYRSAANYLSVATAGAERVRFTDAAVTIINPTTTPFTPEATTKQALVLKLLAGQTGNAIDINSSSGSGGDIFKVSATGVVTIASTLQMTGQIIAGSSSGAFLNSGSTANGWTFRDTGSNVKFQFNNTGIGFFGVTPVARPTALTAADAGALNTGDAGSDTVIGNMRTRIGELETKLQALGLLT